MKSEITKITAEEIKDSKETPTIKVTVYAGNVSGSFAVPSGASTGVHEAHELRDTNGQGVKKAIDKVNNIIAPKLIGQNVLNQKEIDKIMVELDGTPNKDNLGGNSIIGVSVTCAKVAAKISGMETFEYLRTLQLDSGQAQAEIKPSRRTPYLFMNLIEGGKHTRNNIAFQEYIIVPDTENVQEAVDIGMRMQNTLKEIIIKELNEKSIVLGYEGGFAPEISDIRKPLELIAKAIKENNLTGKVKIALDVAASSFFNEGVYKVDGKNTRPNDRNHSVGQVSKEELMNIYNSLVIEFNLFSIEDPFDEEDFDSFRKLRENNMNLWVVGDDLTVTNVLLLKKAIEKGSVNAMIIKPNQIGTLSETLETMRLARENNIELIVSHRGGETDDDFIADLAYAFGCFGLKSGSPLKPERKVKYDRLIKISGK